MTDSDIPKLEEISIEYITLQNRNDSTKAWSKSSVAARDAWLAELLDDAPEHEHRYAIIAAGGDRKRATQDCQICQILRVLRGE